MIQPKEIIERFENGFNTLYEEFVTSMNELHNEGKLDNEINQKILDIEWKAEKLKKMIQKVKNEV